jgi:hypothetical protein
VSVFVSKTALVSVRNVTAIGVLEGQSGPHKSNSTADDVLAFIIRNKLVISLTAVAVILLSASIFIMRYRRVRRLRHLLTFGKLPPAPTSVLNPAFQRSPQQPSAVVHRGNNEGRLTFQPANSAVAPESKYSAYGDSPVKPTRTLIHKPKYQVQFSPQFSRRSPTAGGFTARIGALFNAIQSPQTHSIHVLASTPTKNSLVGVCVCRCLLCARFLTIAFLFACAVSESFAF